MRVLTDLKQKHTPFLWPQPTSQSEQLSKPSSPHHPQCQNPVPLKPCPNHSSSTATTTNKNHSNSSSSLSASAASITAHPRSHSVLERFESSAHQSVAYIDSIKVTFTTNQRTSSNTLPLAVSSSSTSVEHPRRFNGSQRRLIPPRIADRRSRTHTENTNNNPSSKDEVIEIIELQSIEPEIESASPATNEDNGTGRTKRSRKHEGAGELLKDDLRVVVFHQDQEMVCTFRNVVKTPLNSFN